MTSLLESEGWIVTGTLRCECPHCGVGMSSNAFARSVHKKKCEGWRDNGKKGPSLQRLDKALSIAEDHGKVEKERASYNYTPPPAPRLPWIEYRNGSWNEWDVTFEPPGSPRIYLRVREMAECTGGNRYSTYAGKTYIGSYSTLAIAQGSVERLVGVGK